MSRRKKRSAWASLTEASPGVWRIRYWAEGPDGYRRRSKTVRGTRKQAEAVRAQLMLEHGDDAPCPTVRQAWERWALPDMERMLDDGRLSPNSVKQYRSAWSAIVAPTWADVPLDEVRPLGIQQWLYGLGASQAQQAVKVLSRVMGYAVRYELVSHNPMRERYVMPSKSTVDARDRGVWTLSELRDLASKLRGEWYEAAFLLAAFGGLRVGESLAVRSEDVTLADLPSTVALVSVGAQVDVSGRVTSRLKTPASRRVAVVLGDAATRLAEISAAKGGYLTDDGTGRPVGTKRLSAAWTGEHPFRNLRNSWQTAMRWEVRVPVWAIETAMGHRVEGVTGAHYDRPDPLAVARVFADAWAEMGRFGT